MDWSKAKTILIVILLVVCIGLSTLLLRDKIREKESIKQSNASCLEYLVSQGASVNCEIPQDRPALPALFVVYSNNQEEISYKKYEILTPKGPSLGYSIQEEGANSAKIRTASSAILEMVSDNFNISNLVIEDIKLVYYINSEEASIGGEDTALPYWMIKTTFGDYFINAFSQ